MTLNSIDNLLKIKLANNWSHARMKVVEGVPCHELQHRDTAENKVASNWLHARTK